MDDPATIASTLLEASPDGLLLVGADGEILLANGRARVLFGTDRPLVGRSVDELVPSEDRARHVQLRERYARAPERRPMGTGLRLLAEHADGSLFPVEISLSPVEIDDRVCTVATVRDVTEREETMARLALLGERERIARDIHDMVIQRVFAAGMQLQAVAGLIESRAAAERVEAVVDDLDEVIRQLRVSIFQLGQDDGRQSLSAQLASVVEERSRHLGFEPRFDVVGRLDDVPDFVADQLVATLTEALSNVARHAEATAVTVRVERTAAEVRLLVDDDGVGISSSPKTRGGLSNMMWRAAELGGSCSVEPAEPNGTRLSWHVPVGAARV